MTRRQFALLAIPAAASYPCYLEPRWLTLTRPQVTLSKRLAEPVRILHLSDFHRSGIVPLSLIQRAITLGLGQKPDLICVTGDFITGSLDDHSESYTSALARLSAAAPTFAVLGNHDGGSWARRMDGYSDHSAVKDLLRRSGVHLLHNESASVRVRSTEFRLAGVGDLWSDEVDARRAFAGAGNSPTVLLAHNPDTKDVVRHPWDLMLSGHTHGGQVIVPLAGPAFAPVADKRYVGGLAAWGDRQIHVSRGVGSLGGVRFGCRPEVNLLTLT